MSAALDAIRSSLQAMHILLSADSSEHLLLEELCRAWPEERHIVLGPRMVSTDSVWQPQMPPRLVFARQALVDAVEETASSISAWSERLLKSISPVLAEDQPWLLHVGAFYGVQRAGQNRCSLIIESLRERLRHKHRRLRRAFHSSPEPFSETHSLVQLILTAPERGFLSIANAPKPMEFRAVISPYPSGVVPVSMDKLAPSRAFAKLVEAEFRLGRRIGSGEVCVDLGAAPGSWSYVALNRGARVVAVDRTPLRDDLMRHHALSFHKGNAFTFVPEARVDWLLCDVIAAPERSIQLVLDWVRHRRARNFVVTIKFKGQKDYVLMDKLKRALPPLCEELFLSRLCANKNEACVFGTIRSTLNEVC